MAFAPQRIRDPLHNLIEFEAAEFENVLWKVIQTRPFQRLRRIKQLGFSEFVYPGATHSRFAHSIGVFHTARQLMKIIKTHLERDRNYLQSKAHSALAAALVHDVGHGPFSHAFEDVGKRLDLKMADHERLSDELIRHGELKDVLNTMGSGFAQDVADIIRSRGPTNIYGAVVSSQFDADRLDYMRRDRLMIGTKHAEIDFDWLVANLEVGQVPSGVDDASLKPVETFVLGPKAIFAAEAYVLGLFQLYPTVYFHKATRAAEKIFGELLVRLVTLVREGSYQWTGLPKTHPLVRFASGPDKPENVLALDDTVVWGALAALAGSKDPLIREFALRLRDRKFYRAIDVRERIAQAFHRSSVESVEGNESRRREIDAACARIDLEVKRWNSKRTPGSAIVLIDEAEREPYKQFQESKGPLNQIRIRVTEDGELVDLGERSRVVAAIETFRLYRLYFSREDDESHEFVEKVVKRETDRVRKSHQG